MLYIFDKDDNLLEIIEDYSNDELTRDINGTFTFSFKYEVNATENIKKRNKVGFFIDDEKKDNFRLFIIDEVEECYFNDEELYVYCINDYYSLKDNVIIDKRCNNYNVEQTLEKVLENTSYVLGDTINLGTESLNFYYVSSLEAFNNTRETYGFEFDTRIEFNEDYTKINHKYIDIKYRLGQDTGLRFTYDTNLTKVKRIISSENHYNVLYGRGASLETDEGGYTRLLDFADVSDTDKNKTLGQKYVEDINSITKYGRIEGIYENKDIKDATELLNATWNKLQETKEPQVTYEAEAEDIRDIEGFEHYNANLGDSIIILDEDYKLDYESRIIKDVMSIKDKTHKITLGYILPSMTDSIGEIVVNSSDKENIKVNDTNFPNTLPTTPILSMDNEGFATLSLSWTFENKSYYTYILYASQLENFNPTDDNIAWQGQGSSFLHEVNFNETWYYRIRAKNTHNQYTEFSNQVTGTTYKISDATEVFEEAAIKDALIGNLNADRGWIGKFKGDCIDAKNLSVTDGNGNKTLDISSAGDVDLNVRSLKIQNEDVATSSELQQTSKDLQLKFSENGGYNLLYDGDFSRGEEFWIGSINKWFLNGNSLSSDGKAIGVQNTSADVTAYVQQYVENENLINAPKYTISAYVNLKDGEGTVTETSEIRVYCRITYDDDTKIYENIFLDLTKVDEWYRISKTFERDMTKKVKQLSFSVSVKNTTYILFVSQAMLNVGNLIPWSHNPNEVCDGVTKIDKDGITVTASNVKSKTSMSADGFKITKTDTNEDVFKVNSDGTLSLKGNITVIGGSINIADKFKVDKYGRGTFEEQIFCQNLYAGYLRCYDGLQIKTPNDTWSTIAKYDDSAGRIRFGYGAYVDGRNVWYDGGDYVRVRAKERLELTCKSWDTNSETDYSVHLQYYFGTDGNPVIVFRPAIGDNMLLGSSNNRWKRIYSTEALNVASDRNAKENISYINPLYEKATTSDITLDDLYSFIKNELYIAKYNYKNSSEDTIGFIAQDLLEVDFDNSKAYDIANTIVNIDEENNLSYDTGAYMNVLAGALKQAILKIEKLEESIAKYIK